jgi:hypothetical protein
MAGEITVAQVVTVRVIDSVLVEVTEPSEDQPFVRVVVASHTVEKAQAFGRVVVGHAVWRGARAAGTSITGVASEKRPIKDTTARREASLGNIFSS